MKSLLLYANKDSGTLDRLDAAITIASSFNSHIHCLQVTPYEAYVVTDPFGGVYPARNILDDILAEQKSNRQDLEARLDRAGVSWDWLDETGDPRSTAIDNMTLVDAAIVSLATQEDLPQSPAAARLATETNTPVLAIANGRRFDLGGTAVIAWNGSAEASRAVCLAVPLLSKADSVQIVIVSEGDQGLPPLAAAEYLGYHGIKAEVREHRLGDDSVSEAILNIADQLAASYIVMGAYGHSRFREAVLGGVTSTLCERSPFSLFLAH